MVVSTEDLLYTTESKESFNHSFSMFSGKIFNRLYKDDKLVGSETDITNKPEAAYFSK